MTVNELVTIDHIAAIKIYKCSGICFRVSAAKRGYALMI